MLRNQRSSYCRMKLREWRGPEQKGLVLLGQRCCLVTNWYLRRWSHGAGIQTSKRGASANWYWHLSEVWFWQVGKLQPEINLNEPFEWIWMNYYLKLLFEWTATAKVKNHSCDDGERHGKYQVSTFSSHIVSP